jgi:hypothetical protein
MREGLHLVNVLVSPVVLSASSGFGWRMPARVHGTAGSTPVLGSLSKVDWEALVNDCRQPGACGECKEELHGIVGSGSTPGCGQKPQWSNGRTTMRRFSA